MANIILINLQQQDKNIKQGLNKLNNQIKVKTTKANTDNSMEIDMNEKGLK